MANTLTPEALANQVAASTEATTKEVKLNKSKISTVVVSSNEPIVHPDILTIRNYIKVFLDGYKLSPKERSLRFKNVLYFAYNNKTDRVLNELFDFFKKYRNTILGPEQALIGIYYLPPVQQEKIQVLYTLFYRITGPQTGKVDLDYVAKTLGNNNVMSYIAKRIK